MAKAGIVIIIVLGFLAYANSLSGKFIWDDRDLIEKNEYIKSSAGIIKIFKTNIREGAGKKSSTYRPLQMLTYAADYSLWKLKPFGYHLTNMALHIMVALAVYWFILALFQDKTLSLLTGAFFVVHPLHTGAVTYISGRADLLVSLFLLLTFIFYVKFCHSHENGNLDSHFRGNNRVLGHILVISCYILALLSRENAVILPAALLLYRPMKKQAFFSICGVALLYILLRLTLLAPLLSEVAYPFGLLRRIPGFFVALVDYLRLLILPFNMHMEYGQREFGIADPKAILGLFIFTGLLIYAVRQRKSKNIISFGILWFFITLLPVSNIFPVNAYMAEHWLYLPSIGFFLVLAHSLLSSPRKRGSIRTKPWIPAFAGMTIIVYFAVLTVQQNTYWLEPVRFYERTLEFAPDSARVYNNLALTYNNMSENEKALPLLKKAALVDPRRAGTYNNLGLVYKDTGRRNKAVRAFERAVKIDHKCKAALLNLAGIYFDFANEARESGENETAVFYYKKAVKAKPDFANAYNNLGGMYLLAGKNDVAAAMFKKAIAMKPGHREARDNLRIVLEE